MMDKFPTHLEVLQQLLTQFTFNPIKIEVAEPILQFRLLLLRLLNP